MPNEAKLTDAELLTVKGRLQSFINDKVSGGCRMFSIGDACICPLCDLDRLTSRLPAATTEQGQVHVSEPEDPCRCATCCSARESSAPASASPAPDTAALLAEADAFAERWQNYGSLDSYRAELIGRLAAALRAEQEKVKDISHGISVAQIVAADTLIKELQQQVATFEALANHMWECPRCNGYGAWTCDTAKTLRAHAPEASA